MDGMPTPESKQSQNIAPAERSEPIPQKGFRVRVEEPDSIFKTIEDEKSETICNKLLKAPAKRITIDLETDIDQDTKNKTFNLIATVDLDEESIHDHWKRVEQPNKVDIKKTLKLVAEKLKTKPDEPIEERGGNPIVTGLNGTRLVLQPESGSDGRFFHITTGVALSGYRRDQKNDSQVIPSPAPSRENFDHVMADFTQVLQLTIDEIYRAGGKVVPDEELVLRLPRSKPKENKTRISEDAETPSILLNKFQIEKPNVSFEDIGGQAEAKREIQGLAFALKNPDLYKKWGTKPPKGILLHGPPGTGKTLMAKALASQADARFLHIKMADIAKKWYGDSEQTVNAVFELAGSTNTKTIIFFDEIDAVAPQREGAHEATKRVVSTLLENMDGIASNKNVMVVASTNKLESIDPAVLRAGRFDRWVEVPLPDTEGRRQILDIHMRKAEGIAERSLFNIIDVDVVISRMDGSSGADIAEIIRRVLEEKVRQEGMGQQTNDVTTEDIIKEIEGYEKLKQTKKSMGFTASSTSSSKDKPYPSGK